jgi:hypothetical protein
MQLVAMRTIPTVICIAIGQYSPHSHRPPLEKVETQPHANSLISLLMPIAVGLYLRMLKSLRVG